MASPQGQGETGGGGEAETEVAVDENRGKRLAPVTISERWKRKRDKSKGAGSKQIDNTSANQNFKADLSSSNLPTALPGSTQRNVVYYQNRFIVLDTIPAKSSPQTTNGEATTDVQKSLLHTGCGTLRMSERNASSAGDKSNERRARASGRADDGLLARGKRQNMEMDASSVTMDARAIEIVVSDASDSPRMPSQTKHTLWKRVTSVLRDNRMKGRQNLDALNDHPEEYRVLKNVLNALFVTIGVALLLSVFVVIIYTTIVGDPEDADMRRGIDIANEKNESDSQGIVLRERRVAVEIGWDDH